MHSATTNRRLLSLTNALPLPIPVRMGLLGITYGVRGKFATIAADEWASPSQAILARILNDRPDMQLPLHYPEPQEFYLACKDFEPYMNKLSVRLGKEQTFLSRAIRAQDEPNAATWSLMALVTNPFNGQAYDTWKLIEWHALDEATKRGIGDIDLLGRWPREPETA
jgi:hypothetical protein